MMRRSSKSITGSSLPAGCGFHCVYRRKARFWIHGRWCIEYLRLYQCEKTKQESERCSNFVWRIVTKARFYTSESTSWFVALISPGPLSLAQNVSKASFFWRSTAPLGQGLDPSSISQTMRISQCEICSVSRAGIHMALQQCPVRNLFDAAIASMILKAQPRRTRCRTSLRSLQGSWSLQSL